MMDLLEITGDDISKLGDEDLRTLIGLLCEADYRSAGLTTKGIMWGGNQNASDGGLDVVVRCENLPNKDGFVPRINTGFQVKISDMPRCRILTEMQPNRKLRDSIKNLIRMRGAYIIVSAKASTTETKLKNRKDAMLEAVRKESGYQYLHIDFYDRGRIATWVRCYPSLMLWVRNIIDRPLYGWYSYNNWAKEPGGVDAEYLLDDTIRLYNRNYNEEGLSILDGIHNLRLELSKQHNPIRLTGLSGVGKTRLVQALFDERLGNDSLSASHVIYADLSDDPHPPPIVLAEQLISEKYNIVLVVDNCPPDLHGRLSKICSGPESTISLLTIEYDVRDDIPEETQVYNLKPASEQIIERIIKKRYPHISDVDTRTISEMSGGNAKLAIALAGTINKGDSLSGFCDEDLFSRLFLQRHETDHGLKTSAEVCSLVYSFDGENTIQDDSELNFLASLIGESINKLYSDVCELKSRELIQSRGVWRAVLPHALANRLAKAALESIPNEYLLHTFNDKGTQRLIKSFTRRLSYLHDCSAAVRIVNSWLSDDGLIGRENCKFNKFGMDIFKNIAPVSPGMVLKVIENSANSDYGDKFTSRENQYYYEFVHILRQLAYEPDYFTRCVDILIRFSLSEKPDENRNPIRDELKSLFYLYFSGTHAPVESRAEIINRLLLSQDQGKNILGLFLLDAALEAVHFSAPYSFDFGARPRDFGYRPKYHEDVIKWYETFIDICTNYILSNNPLASRADNILLKNLRGLWTNACVTDAVEAAAMRIHNNRPWNDGWIAVRGIMRYDSNRLNEQSMKKLHNLELNLRPNNILDRSRAYVLSNKDYIFDLEDDFDESETPSESLLRLERTVHALGKEVANNPDVIRQLLPDVVSAQNGHCYSFGSGLADGCKNKNILWDCLREYFSRTPYKKRNISVFVGFLSACEKNDLEFYVTIIDKIIDDDILGDWFPIFQTHSSISKDGVERLHRSLDEGRAKIHLYKYIAYGRAHETIRDEDLAGLINKILTKDGGLSVAIEILYMRWHDISDASPVLSDKLISSAINALSSYDFNIEREVSNDDYKLTKIASVCLNGEKGKNAAYKLCRSLRQAFIDNAVNSYDFPQLLAVIAESHPSELLDVFLGSEDTEEYILRRIFMDNSDRKHNPLNAISDSDILKWCEKEPGVRFKRIALVIKPFYINTKTGKPEWRPIVSSLFMRRNDLNIILDNLRDAIMPSMWNGSLSELISVRSELFRKLYDHENVLIQKWAKEQSSMLQDILKHRRDHEERIAARFDQSFE